MAADHTCTRRLAPPPSRSTRPVTPAQACAHTPMLPTPVRVPPPPLHHAAASLARPTGPVPAAARLMAADHTCTRRLAPPPSRSTRPVTPAQACARTPMLPTPVRVPPPPLRHAAAAGPPPCPPRCTLSMVQTGVMVSSARAHHARRPLWPRARYRHFLPPPSPLLLLPLCPSSAPPAAVRLGAAGRAGTGVTLYQPSRLSVNVMTPERVPRALGLPAQALPPRIPWCPAPCLPSPPPFTQPAPRPLPLAPAPPAATARVSRLPSRSCCL